MFQQVKPNPFAIPQAPVGIEPTQFNLPKPKSGGMFGGGDWKTALAAALAGFSAGGGNPAAAQALQALHMNRMQKQRQEQEEQQYQRQRTDGMQDWIAKQQWELQNKQQDPTAFARDLMAAGHQPGSPEFQRLYNQYVSAKSQTGGSLFGNLFKDPMTGQQYIPGSLPPLGQEMDDPRTQGGPRPLGVGSFPSGGY